MGLATGEVVIIQDADTEYNPKDFKAILEPILNGKASVVYGSRTKGIKKYKNKYSSTFFYLGGRVLTFYTNLL